jgi:hypothetical protein
MSVTGITWQCEVGLGELAALSPILVKKPKTYNIATPSFVYTSG